MKLRRWVLTVAVALVVGLGQASGDGGDPVPSQMKLESSGIESARDLLIGAGSRPEDELASKWAHCF